MVWRPAERITRQQNDMKTTEHLDKPATSGSAASTIKAEEYDLLILGSGAAGKLLSWTLAKKGMKTAVIERKYVGGSCPNIACLPSKNIIHSAQVASYFRRSEEFGITKDDWKSTCRLCVSANARWSPA